MLFSTGGSRPGSIPAQESQTSPFVAPSPTGQPPPHQAPASPLLQSPSRARLKSAGNTLLIVLVSALSVYYTGAFWLDAGGSIAVLVALVAVWELGKFLRSDDVAERLAGASPELASWLDTMLVLVLALAFVLGSAAYTVGGVLVNAHTEAAAVAESARVSSARIPTLQAELATLGADIAQAQAEVKLYTDKSWPMNARKSRADLDRYKAQAAAVATQIDELQGVDAARAAGATGVSPRFLAIGEAWASVGLPALAEGEVAQARLIEQGWSLVIGLMLEVLALSLLLQRHLQAHLQARAGLVPVLVPAGWIQEATGPLPVAAPPSPFPPPPGGSPRPPGGREAPPEPGSNGGAAQGAGGVAWDDEAEQRYLELVEKIQRGDSSASVRAVKTHMGCGDQSAEAIRLRLQRDGICRRQGKRLVLLQASEVA